MKLFICIIFLFKFTVEIKYQEKIDDTFTQFISEFSFNTYNNNHIRSIKDMFSYSGDVSIKKSKYKDNYNSIHLLADIKLETAEQDTSKNSKSILNKNTSYGNMFSKQFIQTNQWHAEFELSNKTYLRHSSDYILNKKNIEIITKDYENIATVWFSSPYDKIESLQHHIKNTNNTKFLNLLSGSNPRFRGFGVGVAYRSVNKAYYIFLLKPLDIPLSNSNFENNQINKNNYINKILINGKTDTGILEFFNHNSCIVKMLENNNHKISIIYKDGKLSIYSMTKDTVNAPCLEYQEVDLPLPFAVSMSSYNGNTENVKYLGSPEINKFHFVNFNKEYKKNTNILARKLIPNLFNYSNKYLMNNNKKILDFNLNSKLVNYNIVKDILNNSKINILDKKYEFNFNKILEYKNYLFYLAIDLTVNLEELIEFINLNTKLLYDLLIFIEEYMYKVKLHNEYIIRNNNKIMQLLSNNLKTEFDITDLNSLLINTNYIYQNMPIFDYLEDIKDNFITCYIQNLDINNKKLMENLLIFINNKSNCLRVNINEYKNLFNTLETDNSYNLLIKLSKLIRNIINENEFAYNDSDIQDYFIKFDPNIMIYYKDILNSILFKNKSEININNNNSINASKEIIHNNLLESSEYIILINTYIEIIYWIVFISKIILIIIFFIITQKLIKNLFKRTSKIKDKLQ